MEITVEQFRTLALEKFGFLEANGFHRVPSLENTTPTGGSVVYLGNNVGFIFSLDVRDQCVDGQVVKVRECQIKRNWEGGYSSNIFGHLVKHAGYRGSPTGFHNQDSGKTDKNNLQLQIDGLIQLLRQAGESLLTDKPESLP